MAQSRFSPTHLLLDDAYHVGSVRKDLDILLLDAERPFGDGRLLPLGTLREPPRAASRADVVVFTRSSDARVPAAAERFVGGSAVFFAKHEPVDLVRRTGEALPLSFLSNREVALFSGIARPASFEKTVESLGARGSLAFRFDDHHEYESRDAARMLRETGPDATFVTTEKDWVKACELFPRETEVLALRVTMSISPLDRLERMLFHSPDAHVD